MELRSKKRHKAFTLLETIIALVVTSIGLSLFMGFMLNLKSNLSSVRQDDLAQVEQLVSVLKTRGLSLEYKGTSFGNVVFYSPPRQANYQLKYERNKIWLNQDGQGYMPLLFDVEAFKTKWHDENYTLNLEVKLHGKVIKREVVFAKAKPPKEKQTPKNEG